MDLPRFRYCPLCATALDPAGGPHGRPRCPACHYVQYADPKVATGVVVEHRGQLLLVRRNHEPRYGAWSFPSGFVDAGEVITEAAAREVLEETGVQVRIERLLGVYSTADDAVIFVAYAGSTTGGEPHAGAEALEVGLFSPGDVPELGFPHDAAILERWRSGDHTPAAP
ncbi:MAG: NUDIX domain-containing protein [Dehalococcoidia bacterium]|nr:NUDIX domain-containing protein [Dehalococcoidia bacterium]